MKIENRNLDSSNNFINTMTRGLNSNSDELSSNWRGVYYFLLGNNNYCCNLFYFNNQ